MSQGRGGRKNRGQYYDKNKIKVGDKGREVLENIDENNIVMQQFRAYAAELDAKHDRYESIVKIGRDVTIESKRIIFLLHTIDKESKRDVVLEVAKLRLDTVVQTLFKNIAHELDGQDAYQYNRAYRCGLEEYVEALAFHEYLQNGSMQNWPKLQETLTYDTMLNPPNSTDPIIKTTQVLVNPADYIMGIADLTGELMRKCINNLATGDIASCYQTCNFVRNMYKGFLSCTNIYGKEMHRKLYTLKQSLSKMENVCYTIKVRGSEIPKHMLADVAIVATEEYTAEDDEGYQAY